MSANSIRSNLDKNDIITEIKLLLSADLKKENVFLLVEGDDDISFIGSKVSSSVYIYESFSGKKGVKQIVDFFENKFSVIGLCDRDYDQINSTKRCFFYDHNCLEMMLAKNNSVFNCIHAEYYQGTKPSTEILNELLSNLLFLGEVRKLNQEKSLGLKLKDFTFGDCIENDCYLNPVKIIEKVKKRNPKKSEYFPLLDLLLNSFNKNDHYDYDYYFDTINGHDFLHFLQHSIRRYTNKSKKTEDIASSFRCAYKFEDFRSTTLFNCLKKYEEEKNLSILLQN